MKRTSVKLYLLIMLISVICLNLTVACNAKKTTETRNEYGVFLGINGSESAKLSNYQLVVIEPSEFTAAQIELLKADGKKVYGYLNIGTLETYRPYYEKFRNILLDVYDDWPDESWIDVSNQSWQDFIANDLAKKYVESGLDGFFLDNTDVYYHYPSQAIFDGLRNILKRLKTYRVALIINGGDVFVKKCISQNDTTLFDGINQETVFTAIDFETKTFGIQNQANTDYLKTYLSAVKAEGLDIYLLEYGADQKLTEQIETYCQENGFIWYNASDLDLR